MKSKLLILAGLCLVAVAAVAYAFQEEGTVLIGSSEPLTGVGAVLGAPTYIGKLIAVDEINAKGGVLIDGKRVKMKLVSEDDQAKPDQGVAVFRKLAEKDRVLIVTGTTYSRVTESQWGLLQKKLDDPNDKGLQVPAFSFLSMKVGLTAISPWAFRNAGDEPDQHELALSLVEKRFGPMKRVAGALESNEPHSVSAWLNAYRPALERRGIKPVAYVEWFEQDTDFSVQVRKLKRANPELFIMSSHYQANVGSMLEAARQGWKPRVVLSHLGSDAIEMIEMGGRTVEAIIFPSTMPYALPDLQPLFREYKRRTGEDYAPAMTGLAYEGIYMVKWAIENSGIKNRPETLQQDRRKLRDTLARLKDWKSPAGMTISFDAMREIKRPYYMVQIRDGKFQVWWDPAKGYVLQD